MKTGRKIAVRGRSSNSKAKKPRVSTLISDDTTDFAVGPISLNVRMARAHGWTERQLERAAAAIGNLSRHEGGIATRRHPELYEVVNGVVIYTGALPDGVCDLAGVKDAILGALSSTQEDRRG